MPTQGGHWPILENLKILEFYWNSISTGKILEFMYIFSRLLEKYWKNIYIIALHDLFL